VSLTWRDPDASLNLRFNQLDLNPRFPTGAFELSPPEGVVRVELGSAPESGERRATAEGKAGR
jgi:hypothetical protein